MSEPDKVQWDGVLRAFKVPGDVCEQILELSRAMRGCTDSAERWADALRAHRRWLYAQHIMSRRPVRRRPRRFNGRLRRMRP